MFNFTKKGRKFLFLLIDVILISFAIYLAFLLRFEGQIPAEYFEGALPATIILTLLFSLPIFYIFGLYSFSWSYVSTEELISLIKGITLGFMLLAASLFILRDQPFLQGFPRSVFLISYLLVFIFCGAIRLAKRIYLQIFKRERFFGEKTLIVGAGDAGEQILRSIQISKNSSYLPVGFVDDNPMKQGEMIHGLKVLGKIDDISKNVKEKGVEEVIIALPSAGSKAIKRAVEMGREANLKKIKIVPSVAEIMNGEVSIGNIREVQVEDLLAREPISLDTKSIENFIQNKIILITGAAGSIGSELSRQVAKFRPSLLLMLDQDETGIFNISEELKDKFPRLNKIPLIVDIREEAKIDQIFKKYQPQVVFHAAAYKHVPLMEIQPDEAVKNNIFGTEIVAEAALRHGAEKLIFVSTDKAVNPCS
ncbi:polysaccharide biosynthesis protein, partial [Patescibacteria group bacterium]|nr:polysaccharide biosynthesis protein [Patescibacteria group bacterium]